MRLFLHTPTYMTDLDRYTPEELEQALQRARGRSLAEQKSAGQALYARNMAQGEINKRLREERASRWEKVDSAYETSRLAKEVYDRAFKEHGEKFGQAGREERYAALGLAEQAHTKAKNAARLALAEYKAWKKTREAGLAWPGGNNENG